MEAINRNSGSFKDFEYKGWEMSVQAYERGFVPLTRQCIPALMEVLEVEKGDEFLDVATGPGYVARAASQRGARTVGIDFSPEMVNLAASQCAEVDFKVGDAESLAFADHTFDKVAMAFGILHLEHPEEAVREAYRVLRSKGKYAFTAWVAPDEGSPGFSTMMEAIRKHGSLDVPLPAGPGFFHYSDPVVSESLLTKSGFTDVKHDIIKMLWQLEQPQDFFQAFYAGTARTGGLLRAQKPAALQKVREEAEALVTSRFSTEEGILIPMHARVFSGCKRG